MAAGDRELGLSLFQARVSVGGISLTREYIG